MNVEHFAKTFLSQLVIDTLFDSGRLNYDWTNGEEPDDMATVPAAAVRMSEIEDVVGDVFHHEGDRLCVLVYSLMPKDGFEAYFAGPIRHTVAHEVAARCASGDVYRTNYDARKAVIIDGEELAPNFWELCKLAELVTREQVEAFFSER